MTCGIEIGCFRRGAWGELRFDEVDKNLRAEGLSKDGDIGESAELVAEGVVEACDEDDGDASGAADGACECDAVAGGHVEVGDDEVDAAVLEKRERPGTGGSGKAGVAVALETGSDGVVDRLVVVDHDYGGGCFIAHWGYFPEGVARAASASSV